MFSSGFGSNMFNLAKAMQSPSAMYDELQKNNPKFRSFVEDNKDLSVEEIARKYGVSLEELRNIAGKVR